MHPILIFCPLRMQHRKPIALAPHWSSFLSGKVVSVADSIHRRGDALNCEFYSHWRANASHFDCGRVVWAARQSHEFIWLLG